MSTGSDWLSTRPTMNGVATGLLLLMTFRCVHAQQPEQHSLQQQAQWSSELSFYGDIDVATGSVQFPGMASTRVVESGLEKPSYLGLSGATQLASGVQAVFALESYLSLDTGVAYNKYYPDDPFWGRAAYAGVATDIGTLTAGRNPNPFYRAAAANNAFGESFFSPALTVGAFRLGHVIGRAHNNSLRYSSPTVAGFSVNLLYGFREQASNGDDFSATLDYRRGPFAAAVGIAQAKSGLREDTKSSINLYAVNYDFHVLKLFVEAATQRDTDVGVKSKAWDVGVNVPVGSFVVKTAYARIRQTDLFGGAPATESVLAVGADWLLTKRTNAYLGYKHDTITGLAGADSVAVGLAHQFTVGRRFMLDAFVY